MGVFRSLQNIVGDIYSTAHMLAVPYSTIQRARIINTDEFFALPGNPFTSSEYLSIGYPFKVGRIARADRKRMLARPSKIGPRGEKLVDSGAVYIDVCNNTFKQIDFTNYSIKDEEGINPDHRPYLENSISYITAIDYYLYAQPKLKLHYEFDYRLVSKNTAHRFSLAGMSDWHIDNCFGQTNILPEILNEIRAARKLDIKDELTETGLVRNFAFASKYPTWFRRTSGEVVKMSGKPIKFREWDVYHWLAEPHLSPHIPRALKRAFFVARIAPV